ncbi:MAG: hypothetical protein PHT13_14025, partial [Methanosarcina sp.]|nr:hypothetical protein [Methanosarcina sp.]
ESKYFDALNLFSPPPVLRGYMYGAQEAHEARNSNRLLAIRLETNTSCNLHCRYCYAQSGEDSVKVANFNALKRIISEAKFEHCFNDRGACRLPVQTQRLCYGKTRFPQA